MKKTIILSALALACVSAGAQELKEGYIVWGTSSDKMGQTITDWQPGQTLSEDDHFFISRIKPKARFRNVATQVRQNITEANDKKLIAWIPVNDEAKNALPDGVFDSEVFTLWPYVTHWGNWSAPLGRVPAAFLDVAHKNGVGVSSVAGIPYGNLIQAGNWKDNLLAIANAGADKMAQFLHYYGVDGLGYNSEFSNGFQVQQALIPYHVALVKKMKGDYANPVFENFWYDGTNDNGVITFDQGLGNHNQKTFGDKDNVAASLFFNYNWNRATLLANSVTKANELGRDPLDLYAGVNMQGNEPATNNWPLLKDYPISIGLWGAHSKNMFWESRGEKGSDPAIKQNTYMLRTERWFTGGSRNPASCPDVIVSNQYNADNFSFHGMSSFMSARSSLSWNLSEEPFISYFNLGNGKFFNWQGVRQNDNSWYNVGVQDYLPTWRWWFADKLLGRTAADVPATGMDAEFVWDDAYVGGSCLRIFGSTNSEYLHLFKTQYALQMGDVITLRYKLRSGSTDLSLVLTAEGQEGTAINENAFQLCSKGQLADEDTWMERTFTVDGDLAGKTLAMIALHFTNTTAADLLLGECSIVRGTSVAPAKPQITKAQVLAYSRLGVDGKIIFNMPNDKATGEPCYNIDVNTALFKLYAQQEGKEPVLMGLTTSWAGMFYSVPLQLKDASQKVRFGVAAVSLDMKSDSEIAWSDYMETGTYIYNDDVQCNKNVIKPGETFEMSFVDPMHESATWTLYDVMGNKVFEQTGHTITVEGLPNLGSYDLVVKGAEYNAAGTARPETERRFSSFIQITSEGVGALPEIYTLTANGEEADIEVKTNEEIALAYTGRKADGAGSQGVNLAEQRFGVKCADLGVTGTKSFSVAFWLKINKLAAGETQLLSVANKQDGWPKTDWGWIWCNIQEDGSMGSFTFRGTDMSSNNELQYTYGNTKLPIGNWVHLAYTFDWKDGKFRADYYVNGVKQNVTKWKRTNSGEQTTQPGYESQVYQITSGQVLAIGGDAHGRAGIDGTIDNLVVYDGVLTDAEVKASMGDINPSALPSNVLAFWNLEDQAGADNTFAAVGSKAGVKAGTHSWTAGGGEGQGTFGWLVPEYTSGCPFIAGTAFPVVTKPTWKANKGVVSNSKGNGESGRATLTYSQGGDYRVTLTLANSLGQASRTFHVIKVKGIDDGIHSVGGNQADVMVVSDRVLVDFDQAGTYTVRVYNAAGQAVATKTQEINAGQQMQVTLGAPGTYVVKVESAGKALRSVKLLRK